MHKGMDACVGGALEGDGHLGTPHFFLQQGSNPKMDALRQKFKESDAYLLVTPEYNHSIPPALSCLMGHFGGSNYALKPSAIVSYSPGLWGGMRGAMALRPFLSELGCIPISKLTGFPAANNLFAEDGTMYDPNDRIHSQLPKMLQELEWMACAMKRMREDVGLPRA